MNVAWSIYPGANGGGLGDLVNGIDNALSKGLGDVGRGSGNPLGMLAALGGLAAGALRGMNSLGNRFKLYRDFKENCIKKPYNAIKDRLKSAFGMSDDAAKSAANTMDDAAKGAVNSMDDALRGGTQAAGKAGAAAQSVILDQFGRPMNIAGSLDDATRAAGSLADDAARTAGSLTDDAARAAGTTLGRVGSRAIPLVGVAIDGAFRYQDYKTTESRYQNALAQHKEGKISDETMADVEHIRGASHSRNAAGMAGGLIGATLAAGAVGAGVGFTAGGIGAIPGFLIGAGAGILGYYVGDKVGASVSDAAWGEPPSYAKSAEALNRNAAENGVAKQTQGHDAGQAWAAARQNSTYAHTGDIRTPGIVSDPAVASKFSDRLAGAGAAAAAPQAPAADRLRSLARGRSSSVDPRLQDRRNTIG